MDQTRYSKKSLKITVSFGFVPNIRLIILPNRLKDSSSYRANVNFFYI